MKIYEPLSKFQVKFLEVSLSVASIFIGVMWKSYSPLLFTKWYLEMNRCVPLENSLRKRYDKLVKIWQLYQQQIN